MKILIELPTWLGDTVMTTPSIENIINHFSNVEIVIIGSANSNSITLGVPVDITSGSYEIPATGFIASYTVDQITENAIDGTIIIVEHDTANNTLKGTFSFKTASNIISVGQFNVTYQ